MTDKPICNLWLAIPIDAQAGHYTTIFPPRWPAMTVRGLSGVLAEEPIRVGPNATENVAIDVTTGRVVRRWPVK